MPITGRLPGIAFQRSVADFGSRRGSAGNDLAPPHVLPPMTTRLAFGALFAVAAVIAGCGSARRAGDTGSNRAAHSTLAATSRWRRNPAAPDSGGPGRRRP